MQSVLNLVDMATSPQSWELKEIHVIKTVAAISKIVNCESFGSAAELVLFIYRLEATSKRRLWTPDLPC